MRALIEQQKDGTFYALVVRDENNSFGGVELIVVGNYKPRFFKTEKAALKSTGKYINQIQGE